MQYSARYFGDVFGLSIFKKYLNTAFKQALVGIGIPATTSLEHLAHRKDVYSEAGQRKPVSSALRTGNRAMGPMECER